MSYAHLRKGIVTCFVKRQWNDFLTYFISHVYVHIHIYTYISIYAYIELCNSYPWPIRKANNNDEKCRQLEIISFIRIWQTNARTSHSAETAPLRERILKVGNVWKNKRLQYIMIKFPAEIQRRGGGTPFELN